MLWRQQLLRNTVMLAICGRAAPKGRDPEMTPQQEACSHPPSQVRKGANQWASWTRCGKCNLRLTYVSKNRHHKARKEKAASASTEGGEGTAPPSAAASSSEAPRLPEMMRMLGETLGAAMRPALAEVMESQRIILAPVTEASNRQPQLMIEAQRQTSAQIGELTSALASFTQPSRPELFHVGSEMDDAELLNEASFNFPDYDPEGGEGPQ